MNGQTTTLETVETKATSLLISMGPATSSSILTALADRFSERILAKSAEEAKTVEEISSAAGIPLSTCYRRIRELIDAGLVIVDRIVITTSGKRYATYRSCYRSFRISADPHGIVVQAEVNKEAAEKLWNRRFLNDHAGQSVVDGVHE
jgi:DNA-binding transcriptional ArsR family regulator